MDNQTVNIFKSIFEDLNIPHNSYCKCCDAKFKAPLLPWVVGTKYWETKERILFVGKPHRGEPGERFASGILGSTKPHLDWLLNCPWPYWRYTKEICSSIYGNNDPWDFVSYTNIIKCTNVIGGSGNGTQDTTTLNMAKSCIENNKVIFHEIRTLEPRHIVFFTYDLFKEFINVFPFQRESKLITPINHRVACGKKNIGWWTRTMKTDWYENVKCLVTHHPERKKKSEYIKLIVDWIIRNGKIGAELKTGAAVIQQPTAALQNGK